MTEGGGRREGDKGRGARKKLGMQSYLLKGSEINHQREGGKKGQYNHNKKNIALTA